MDPEKRRAEIMTSWREVTQDLCKGASRWDEKALDAAQGPHPLLGTLSLREMLEFTVYHTTHHLRIVAERVRAGDLSAVTGGSSCRTKSSRISTTGR